MTSTQHPSRLTAEAFIKSMPDDEALEWERCLEPQLAIVLRMVRNGVYVVEDLEVIGLAWWLRMAMEYAASQEIRDADQEATDVDAIPVHKAPTRPESTDGPR